MRTPLPNRFYVALLLALVLGTSPATAQTVGKLFGSVVDARTREPLIGVTIRVGETSGGTVTDVDGNYLLPDLTPGTYNLTASYLGYATQTRGSVPVRSRGNDAVNFALDAAETELETVVVRANPFRSDRATPLSLQRLSPEEIRTYPGGNNDIAKVVQSLPGIQGSVSGFRNDVIIRGGAPNENVYYLDGIEIPNINHFSTQGSAGGPVGLLNVDFIEGVELTSSAFAARYDNPLSGVLQFDQRVGNRRERQTNLRISGSEAAITTEGPLLRGKDKSKEAKVSYLLSVRRSYLQLLFKLIGLPIRPDYYDYQYKINYEVDDYNTLYLTGIGSIDDFGVESDPEFDPEQRAQIEQIPVIRQWTTTSGIGWRRRLKNGTGLMSTAVSINVLDNEFSRFTDNENETGLLLRTKSRETEQKLRYAYTRFLGAWTLQTGFNVTRADYTTATDDLLRNESFASSLDLTRYGLFAQLTRSFLVDRLSFSAGVRADDNTFTSERGTLGKTVSPRLALGYTLDPAGKWRVSATAGKYYKILPYTVLGFTDAAGDLVNRGAAYTGSLHAGLGVERQVGTFGKLSVEGFYKKYSDYPVSITDGVSLANKGADFSILGSEAVATTGAGRTYGAEFLYQQKLYKNVYLIAAYTLYRSEFTGLDREVYLPSVWDSRHLVSLTGGYRAPHNWEFSGRFRFAGPSPFASVDTQASLQTYPVLTLDYTGLQRNRLASFQQLDIRIDKKWNFTRLSLNLFLEIQNALAAAAPAPPEYGLDRTEAGDLIDPRNLIVLPEDAGRPLPSIGVAVDF